MKKSAAKNDVRALMQYAPSSEAVYNAIVPEYVGGLPLRRDGEKASPAKWAHAASAMDAASKNAGEMIEDLSLKYNRARQGAITQEITGNRRRRRSITLRQTVLPARRMPRNALHPHSSYEKENCQ